MTQEPFVFHGKTYASYQEYMEERNLQRLNDFKLYHLTCPELTTASAEKLWHIKRKEHGLE